ncbi:MAG: hypothetical protein HUJ58_00480 [Erysipelotrichaceae bacterium]|nr:hypothetical protein [Erysipelotrichaceae bacterium]
MSKGRSGLFPSSVANDKILRATAYRAIHSMIINTPGGKGRSMAIGAYDIKTGKIVTTFAGKIPDTIHPELQKRADRIGGIGTKGQSTKNSIGVCAEFHAVNELLLSGSNISDIKLTHAIRPRTGKGRPYCINCKKMFSDLIK